jgi:hypothetical protein
MMEDGWLYRLAFISKDLLCDECADSDSLQYLIANEGV